MNSPANADSARLRAAMRAKRRSLPLRERQAADLRITQKAWLSLKNMRRVAVFMGFDGEPQLSSLSDHLQTHGIELALPRIARVTTETGAINKSLKNKRMQFVALRKQTRLRKNRFGIWESGETRRFFLRELDAILVPLTAFDEHRNRLGMGAGFYDRALANRAHQALRRPLLIGVAYACQQTQNLLVGPTDVRMHKILTERGWR